MRNVFMAVIIIILLYTGVMFTKNNIDKFMPLWLMKDYKNNASNH